MSIALLAINFGRINKHQIESQVSAAIRLPTTILVRKIRLPGARPNRDHAADITEVLDVEASLLGAEKHFFR
jgi:hypothetical protein